jgi:hypothetical protein
LVDCDSRCFPPPPDLNRPQHHLISNFSSFGPLDVVTIAKILEFPEKISHPHLLTQFPALVPFEDVTVVHNAIRKSDYPTMATICEKVLLNVFGDITEKCRVGTSNILLKRGLLEEMEWMAKEMVAQVGELESF